MNRVLIESMERIRVADSIHSQRMNRFSSDPFSFVEFLQSEALKLFSEIGDESSGRSSGTDFENDSSNGGGGESVGVAGSSANVEFGGESG